MSCDGRGHAVTVLDVKSAQDKATLLLDAARRLDALILDYASIVGEVRTIEAGIIADLRADRAMVLMAPTARLDRSLAEYARDAVLQAERPEHLRPAKLEEVAEKSVAALLEAR